MSSFYSRPGKRITLKASEIPNVMRGLGGEVLRAHGFAPSNLGVTDFGTDIFTQPTAGDVAAFYGTMQSAIGYLHERFKQVEVQWQQADSAACTAFKSDLAGLDKRWADAADACKDEAAQNLPSIQMVGLTKAVAQNGNGGEWKAGDYLDLSTRLTPIEAQFHVTPPPGPVAIQPPVGTDEQFERATNSLPTLTQATESGVYWLKVAAIGILAGISAQVIMGASQLRKTMVGRDR